MHELRTFLEFFLDLVCVMPPLHEVEGLQLPTWLPPALCLGGIVLLSICIFGHSLREIFDGSATGYVMGAVLAVVVFAFTPWRAWTGIFLASYPPLVMSIRFGEGALLGALLRERRAFWWWLLPALLLATAIFAIVVRLPMPAMSFMKALWAVVGATTASVKWSQWTADELPANLLGGWIPRIGIVVVLFSTILYVSSSPIDELIYMAILPVGWIAGMVLKRTGSVEAS